MPVVRYTGNSNRKVYWPDASMEKLTYYPVVTLKAGTKIDTASGDGSLNKPYSLTK